MQRISAIIGKNIKLAREEKKLKQEHLAEAVKISRTSLSNIERGKHSPQLSLLYQLCNELDLEVAKVLPKKEEIFLEKKNMEYDIVEHTPNANQELKKLRDQFDL